MEELIHKIKESISLTNAAEAHIYSISTEKKIKKGDILIHQGQVLKKSYFVKSGCLRSFCVDKEGKEHTLLFAISGWWISDFIAMHNNEEASQTVECISNAVVYEFDIEDLQGIFTLYPELETFQRKNLERHVVTLYKRVLNQLQLTAGERYEVFLKQYPDIEQLTPNYHIASYLGITQQSLSRIRAQKARKQPY